MKALKSLMLLSLFAAAPVAAQDKNIVETAVAAGSFKTLVAAVQADPGIEVIENALALDLLVDDRKLAGVLAEARPDPAAAPGSPMLAVVVGIGLNVGWAPEGAARLGDGIDPLAVAAEVLAAFDRIHPEALLDEYRAHLATLGRRVRVELATGSPESPHVVEGRALDVEADGRLVVLDDCAITHRFAVGDVVHLR